MDSELRVDPRHEKNRHHFATALVTPIVVAVFAVAFSMSMLTPIETCISAFVFALVLLIRTVNIETGVRRSSLDSGRALQRKERGLLVRYFGITFVEDVPQLSKQNDLV